jgi:hypothetical protein
MKKSLLFLSAAVLALSTVFISACSDDEGGGVAEVPPAKIKTIEIDYSGDGSETEQWEFIYDNQDRVASINILYNGESDGTREYDYSVDGQLTINRNGSGTVYALDAEGRVVKEFWNAEKTEWEGYEYDADGIMKKVVEHYDGEDFLKYEMTIENKNVTHRIRYDGETVREDRVFTYTIADNASGIHQIYAVDSEWKNIAGLYGKQSKKLADTYLRKITEDPTSNYGADYDYTFDAKNRVATQTKVGTSSGGTFTEKWAYTYYEDEE